MDAQLSLRILEQLAAKRNRKLNVEYRDFRLRAGERRELHQADLVYCVEFADENITIESATGIYNLLSESLTECQHVHEGVVTIENTANFMQRVTLVVAILR